MNKGLLAVIAVILLSILGLRFATKSKADCLTISYNTFSFEQITLQIEPHPTNDVWFTNHYGTNLDISGSTYNTALIGPTVKLMWEDAYMHVLQCSPDLTNWHDIRIIWLGNEGIWYTYPMDKRFYRLRPL